MMARLLHEAGLDLGADADIMPPADSNPEGHWENLRFVEINDAILDLAGGAWDRVPKLDEGWHLDAKFDDLVERATALINTFASREPWGWKDPRNSLTLPFWQRLLPDVKVVIALRNPVEVVGSLLARNQMALPVGAALWAEYTSRALAAVPVERRLVTHYESYFADFRTETRRLLDFAGLRSDDAAIDRLHDFANDSLRHNRRRVRESLDGRVPAEIVRQYLVECGEAGSVFMGRLALDVLGGASSPVVGDPRSWYLAESTLHAVDQDRAAARLQQQIDALNESLLRAQEETGEARRIIDKLRTRLSWWRHRWVDNAANALAKLRGREPEAYD